MSIIRQRRLDLGLSQEQLAIKCAVPRQRISEYERGVALPDRETSNRISQQIGVKVLLDQDHILKPGKTNLCAIRRYEMREPKREIWTRAFARWREQIRTAKLPERVRGPASRAPSRRVEFAGELHTTCPEFAQTNSVCWPGRNNTFPPTR